MIYYKTKNALFFVKENKWHKASWESVKDAWTWLSPKLQADFIRTEQEVYSYGHFNDPTTSEYSRNISVRIMPEDMTEEMLVEYLKVCVENNVLGVDLAPNPRYITLVSAVKALAKKHKLEVEIKKETDRVIIEFSDYWFEISLTAPHVVLKRSDFTNFKDLKFKNVKYLLNFIENIIELYK